MRHLVIAAALLAWSPLSLAGQSAQLGLNSADAAQLASIDGVSEGDAQRLVALRDTRGQLSSVEAARVLSLSEQTLDALRSNTSVELSIHKTASSKSFSKPEDVLATFSAEPDIRAVQAMAMAYTRTNPELVDGWLRSSRRAYMLPKLNLQYEKKLNYNEDYEYVTDDAGEILAELDAADLDNDDKYVIKLEWRLDKLVMSSERIRVINESQDIVKLRDKVLDEITRLYFDRRRLQVDRLLSPPRDLQSQLKDELRLQELTANIDALTGGSFSASLPQ